MIADVSVELLHQWLNNLAESLSDNQVNHPRPLTLDAPSESENIVIAQNNIVVGITPGITRLFGYTAREMSAMMIDQLLCQSPTTSIAEQGKTGNQSSFTAIGTHKDGKHFPIAASCHNHLYADTSYQIFSIYNVDNLLSELISLRRLKKRYVAAATMAGFGIWERDFKLDKGFWCESTYTIFGTSPDHCPPTWERFLQQVHPQDREYVIKQIQRASQHTGAADFHYRIIRPDGTVRDLHSISDVIRNPDGSLRKMIGSIQDVTEQQELARQLQASETKFKLLVKSIKDLFWIRSRNMQEVFYISPSLQQYRGDSFKNLTQSLSFFDVVHPDDQGLLEKSINSYHKLGKPYETEYRIIDQDSTVHWIRECGFPAPKTSQFSTMMAGVCTDISQQKKDHEELETQANTLQAIFDASSNVMAIISEEFRIEQINKKGASFTGESEDTARGMLIGTLLQCINAFAGKECGQQSDCQNCPIKTRIETTFSSGKSFHETEDQLAVLTNGRQRTLDLRISTTPLTIAGKRKVLLSLSDISAIKQIERQNTQLQKKLAYSQRLESIGTLAGGIAHDFNNILTAILGFTDLALADTQPNTLIAEDLQEIYAAGQRGRELVNQILTFARQSDATVKPLRLEPIMKEVFQFLRSSIPTNIEMSLKIHSNSLISGSPTEMHQVLMNLCANAAQAMEHQGGRLEVSLSNTTVSAADQHQNSTDLQPGTYVSISITDTGAGIAPQHIDSIFDPYFTTKGPGEGTGLGLATVHGIIENYGGSVSVTSELGQGTTFRILLPATSAKSDELQPAEEPVATGTEHILFIDDELAIAKLAQKMLERLGYTVTTRTSSLEALELFRSRNKDFDLVITDMTMPKMTGYTLALKMRAIRPDLPIILCTGYSKTVTTELINSAGISALIRKPILKVELAKAIRDVLDHR